MTRLLVILVAFALGACGSGGAPVSQAEMLRRADSLQNELDATRQYEALLQRLLVDSNPVRVQSALLCETQHVLGKVGPARLVGALESAEERAYTSADHDRRIAVEGGLRNKLVPVSVPLCRQLALEGFDLDTSWMIGSKQ